MAAVEGITQIKTGKLIAMSEQQLVDCDRARDNTGCSGGLMEDAFEYIMENGLVAQASYPYTGKDDKCDKIKSANSVVTINGYKRVRKNDETSLQATAAQQPVSAAIDAVGFDFQFYSSGVFRGPCSSNLNHGVTIVGYGDEGDKYWIVKNSWGSQWGEAGYVRMLRGVETGYGMCGIAAQASYPLKN